MIKQKAKKTIKLAVVSPESFCVLDSFSLFKHKGDIDLVKASHDRIVFLVPAYNLVATFQDDNSLKVQYCDGSYILKIERKTTNLGKAYYSFFLCPACSTRVRKLYCIQGKFLCRKCGHLGYYSQKLNFYDRLMYMQIKIEAILQSKGGSLERKPPWMKCRTFKALKFKKEMYEARYYYAAELELAKHMGLKPPRLEDYLPWSVFS